MKALLARSMTVGLLLATLLLPQFSATILGADRTAEDDHRREGEEAPGHDHDHGATPGMIEIDLTLGDEGPAVAALQHHLEMAGFLHISVVSEGIFDDPTNVGLRRFQRHHGLMMTGVVDEATYALMNVPRFDDMPDTEDGAAENRSLSYTTRNYWSNTNLTYAFKTYTSNVSQAVQRAAVRQAFDTWLAVTPLVIIQVASTSEADIVVSFESGDHGEPSNGGRIAGDTYFDDAETWTLSVPVPVASPIRPP